MLFKLSILVALVARFASALTVTQPTQAVNNGGFMTFNWQVAPGDPALFSVFLSNPSFNNKFAVANTVDASLETLTIQVPAVPDNESYTIQLTPIDNANQVLAESGSFNIGAITAGTSTPSASASTTSASVTTRSTTVASVATTSRVSTPLSSFGVTVPNSAAATSTAPALGGSSGAAASSTPSNSAALPTRFNMNMGVVASMVLSVAAGAAVIAL